MIDPLRPLELASIGRQRMLVMGDDMNRVWTGRYNLWCLDRASPETFLFIGDTEPIVLLVSWFGAVRQLWHANPHHSMKYVINKY
jgi:hypothetical protein